MQTVYIATIRASHDFDSLRETRVFASRVVAYRWARTTAEHMKIADEAYDGWDGYHYACNVEAVLFNGEEALL